MPDARFRVARGKVLIIPAAEEPEWKEVRLIHDHANGMVGLQIIGEQSELKGWVFLVSEASFAAVKERGTPTEALRL